MSPEPLTVRVTTGSPRLVLELAGYLNGSTHHLLHAQLHSRRDGDPEVGIDLERVTFIDSDGVEALLEADRQLRREGRRLVLMNVSTSVSRSLALFGLDEQFELEHDETVD